LPAVSVVLLSGAAAAKREAQLALRLSKQVFFEESVTIR